MPATATADEHLTANTLVALIPQFREAHAPLVNRLKLIAALHDPAHQLAELQRLEKDFPEIAKQIFAGRALADAGETLAGAGGAAVINGMAEAKQQQRSVDGGQRPAIHATNAGDFDESKHPRGDHGKWSFAQRDAQRQRGEAAIATLLKEKTDIPHAMEHPDLGHLDFRQEGAGHVVQRGDERFAKFGGLTGEDVLRKMPTVIAHGELTTDAAARKAVIEHEGYRAILAKDYHGAPSNRWLLSGYDISPEKGGHQ